MKLILITLVAVVVGLMVACGGSWSDEEYEYPKEVAENYVERCVLRWEAAGESEKDVKKYCDCTLKALERDNTLSTNFTEEKVLEIMRACASTTLE
jgi:hypothetical protein